MTKKKRLDLIKEAKELGLKSIEIDGIKYNLLDKNEQSMTIQQQEELAKTLLKGPFDDMTSEEILYWSTPYYDELQENKKKLAEQQKDKESLNG